MTEEQMDAKLRAKLIAVAEELAAEMLAKVPADSPEADTIRGRLESYKAMTAKAKQ